MQTNLGHSMNIRDVIHVPERDQYITVAWDCSMRLWNSWKKPKKIAAQRKKNESDVFAMLRQVSQKNQNQKIYINNKKNTIN